MPVIDRCHSAPLHQVGNGAPTTAYLTAMKKSPAFNRRLKNYVKKNYYLR